MIINESVSQRGRVDLKCMIMNHREVECNSILVRMYDSELRIQSTAIEK